MQMVELVLQVELAAVGKLLVWVAVGFPGDNDGRVVDSNGGVRLINGNGGGKKVVAVDDGGCVDDSCCTALYYLLVFSSEDELRTTLTTNPRIASCVAAAAQFEFWYKVHSYGCHHLERFVDTHIILVEGPQTIMVSRASDFRRGGPIQTCIMVEGGAM